MPAPALVAVVDKATGGKVSHALRWAVGVPVLLLGVLTMSVGGSFVEAEAGSCGPGEVVPASADLPAPTLAAINALKGEYEAAGAATGLSWALLSSVDGRENGHDPGRSALSGEPLGSANPDSGVVTTTKADSLQRAGEHLKAMASSVYGVTLTATSGGEDVQKALVAYNRGGAYKVAGVEPMASPYVYNGFDAQHEAMKFPSIPGEPLAGMTDYRLGSFTEFVRLGGPSGACGGLSDDALVRIAQMEIGNAEDPLGSNDGEAIRKYRGSGPPEAWCGDFVSWVRREAGRPFTGGADGGWRLAGVSGIEAWHRANGSWVDRDPANPPAPGDSMVTGMGEHVGIVERVEGGVAWMISGNSSSKVSRTSHRIDVGGDVLGWGRARPAGT